MLSWATTKSLAGESDQARDIILLTAAAAGRTGRAAR